MAKIQCTPFYIGANCSNNLLKSALEKHLFTFKWRILMAHSKPLHFHWVSYSLTSCHTLI